jgi:hypothetical protein
MSNVKTTNVYYYQLFLNDENLKTDEKEKFLKICDKNILQKKESYIKIEHSDGYVNLYDFEERHKRYVLGTFVYNQTTNIPPSFNEVENKPTELKIGEFDGLGYDSSFIYDRKTRIIGLESKKPGVSQKSVEDFLTENFKIPDCHFKFVILPDEYTKFLNSNDYSRLEIDLAIPNNDMGILKPSEKNANNLLQLMQDLKGSSAKFIISNGRSKKKSLSLENVRQIAQWFYKNEKKDNLVQNLRITGVDIDSENNHIFDLISNRLITKLNIIKTRTIGNFQLKSKYDQLEGDFLANREKLEKLQK